MSYRITNEIVKQIHAVASQLPVLPNEKQVFRQISGAAIINQGHNEVKRNGVLVPVENDKMYDVPFVELETVNHLDNIRTAYTNGGILAVHLYIINTATHLQVMREKYPTHFDESGAYNPFAEHEPTNN